MRVLRFVALIVILALAYFAQYIFDYLSLADFFPDWLLRQVPALAQYTRWLANDLLLLAFGLALGAALAFGLLVPPWRGLQTAPASPQISVAAGRRALPLLAAGLAGGLGILLWLLLAGSEPLWLALLWLLSVVLYCIGALQLDHRRTAPTGTTGPNGGFISVVIVLLLVLGLFGWSFAALPAQLDPALAEFSIEALSLTDSGYLFTPSAQGLPRFAYLTSAAAMQIGQNILREMRLPGLIAGLLTVLATWLLGRELFIRMPVTGPHGEMIEDGGGWIATLAAALLAFMLATMHFARLPFYMEPVAWGVVGLWLLQRSLRRAGWMGMALAGLAMGMATAVAPTGLVFPVVGGLWWVAVAIFNPGWMPAGNRLRRFGIWCGGLFLFLGPLVGSWLYAPTRLAAYLRAPALMDAILFSPDSVLYGLNLRRTLLAFFYTTDISTVFGYPDHLLHSLLAPLFVLAIGALLLNIDSWAGWTVLMWLVPGALIVTALSPRAPFAPVMLPILPAAALAVAFALDRLRVAILESAGAWLEQATLVIVTGLLLWVAVDSWLDYYHFAATGADTTSAVARAAHASEDATLLALVNGGVGAPLDWREARLLLAQSDLPGSQPRTTITAPEWPTALPAGARLLLQPVDRTLADEAMLRYPGGELTITRDLAGNPTVLLYDLP